MQETGTKDVRLALIVASRRQNEWRGVFPDPRLEPLSLTQFKPDVIRGALQDLAGKMHRTLGPANLNRDAARVYRLSEGLPALLALCLRWIQKEQWLGMERLESQQLFETLAKDYIRKELLSHDSLLPREREDDDDDDELRHVLDTPFVLWRRTGASRRPTCAITWSRILPSRELWSILPRRDALGLHRQIRLLVQPLNEPGSKQRAMRRLLFRYFNRTYERRIEAHKQALNFADVWQAGNEPVIGLVECLWHEAAILQLNGDPDMKEKLCNSAREFTESLTPNPLYTETELRRFAGEMIRNDEEFRDTVGDNTGCS